MRFDTRIDIGWGYIQSWNYFVPTFIKCNFGICIYELVFALLFLFYFLVFILYIEKKKLIDIAIDTNKTVSVFMQFYVKRWRRWQRQRRRRKKEIQKFSWTENDDRSWTHFQLTFFFVVAIVATFFHWWYPLRFFYSSLCHRHASFCVHACCFFSLFICIPFFSFSLSLVFLFFSFLLCVCVFILYFVLFFHCQFLFYIFCYIYSFVSLTTMLIRIINVCCGTSAISPL